MPIRLGRPTYSEIERERLHFCSGQEVWLFIVDARVCLHGDEGPVAEHAVDLRHPVRRLCSLRISFLLGERDDEVSFAMRTLSAETPRLVHLLSRRCCGS